MLLVFGVVVYGHAVTGKFIFGFEKKDKVF